MTESIYLDPELVDLYDVLNPPGADTAFYRQLAATATDILDLGCGTGLLTVAMTEPGRSVTGIEPASAMLSVARRRPGGDAVCWIAADARRLELDRSFDLIVMTGHVFQVFLTDNAIADVLTTAYRHLRSGGRLAFESRHPQARAWERWIPAYSARTLDTPNAGLVDITHDLISVDGDLVTFRENYVFRATGKTHQSVSTLRFLSAAEIEGRLRIAGFSEIEWYGDWDMGPLHAESHEMIAVAVKA